MPKPPRDKKVHRLIAPAICVLGMADWRPGQKVKGPARWLVAIASRLHADGGWVGPTAGCVSRAGSARKILIFSFLFFKNVYGYAMTDLETLKAKYTYDPDTGIFTRNTAWGKQAAGDVAGCISPQGYRYLTFKGRATPAHRLAWLWVHGVWPDGDVDHINRDRMDNRISNLRNVSRSVNLHNSAGRALSGFKGVSATTKGSSWQARIMVDGHDIYLGLFKTPEEASAARKGAEIALGLRL